MKKIVRYMMTAVTLFAAVSCTQDEMLEPAQTGDALQFVVGDFPGYAATRAIGTAEDGKTAWEADDKLFVKISGENMESKCLTLTYSDADGGKWIPDNTDLRYDDKKTLALAVTAVYAPNRSWGNDGELTYDEGYQAGMSEYLAAACTVDGSTVSISFSGAERNYSRLRIAGSAHTPYTVAVTDFTPSDGGEAPASYQLTTNANGNAYLYGTFDVNSTVKVEDDEAFTFTETTVAGKSYALGATPAYTVENGTYTVKAAKGLKVLADMVNAGETVSKIVLANDIDLSAYTNWEPIGSITNPYKGSFDGNGHTISGLTINDTEDMDNRQKAWGLFGVIDGGSSGVTIENVKVDGTIVVSNFGSWDQGEESNSDGVGGICGRSVGKVTFLACHNNADVSVTSISFYGVAGGIVGIVPDGTIYLVGCINTGNIVDEGGAQVADAGILAHIQIGTMYMYACYNRAEIKGNYVPAAFISSASSFQQLNFEACYVERVNNSPEYMVAASNDVDGCGEIDGTNVTWAEALTAMNNTLTTKGYTDYLFVKNTGDDAEAIPLLIQKVEAE